MLPVTSEYWILCRRKQTEIPLFPLSLQSRIRIEWREKKKCLKKVLFFASSFVGKVSLFVVLRFNFLPCFVWLVALALHNADFGVASMLSIFHLASNVVHAERDNFITRCTHVMASMCSLFFSTYGNNESTGKAHPPREFLYRIERSRG